MEDPESHALHALEMKEASHAWIPLPNDFAWNMDTEMMIHMGWQWMVHYMHCMLCPTFGVFWLLIFSSCKSKHKAINSNCKTFFFKIGYPCTYVYECVFFFLPYNQTWSPNSFYFKLFQIINQSLKFLILNYTNKTLKDIEQYVKRKNPFFFFCQSIVNEVTQTDRRYNGTSS